MSRWRFDGLRSHDLPTALQALAGELGDAVAVEVAADSELHRGALERVGETALVIIAGIGLYELFVSRIDAAHSRRPVPAWLEMNDLNDLKARVISMIILVVAVTFTDVLLEFPRNELELLYLATGVAIFIIALTIYLKFGSDNGGDHA